MSLFFVISEVATRRGLSGSDPEHRGILSSDLYPLVAPWHPVGPNLKDAGWECARFGNGIRNCLGVEPRRQEQGCTAVARLSQLFEADAAVGTERRTRRFYSTMGRLTGVLCALGDEQRWELRRGVQQLLQPAGV